MAGAGMPIGAATGPVWTAGAAGAMARSQQADRGAGEVARSQETASSSAPGGLGPDAFFRLLAAQLRYQDPLQPIQDTAFVAQLAQLTQLEETRALRAALTGLSALPLLGREVVVATADGERSGPVTGVYLDPVAPGLVVAGVRVPWAEIVSLRLAGEAGQAGGSPAAGQGAESSAAGDGSYAG